MESSNKKMVKSPSNLKTSRVKVGVRCRPAFEDEIEFAKGEFISIIDTKPETTENSLGQISLTLITGKQRDFVYDYVFDSGATQDHVYEKIAKPVVTDVLKGFNGTIFAYGQTGTGKTYTMGILEFVNDEHAGIIPRAIYQIFEHVSSREKAEITVSLSFLQLYRENIQDLLAPVSGTQTSEDNLAVREDPQRGFYVEGLKEYVVRNYRESEALINLGLENRAIAPTLMNSTSSRSHTVLTLNLEQRIAGEGSRYTKTLRSKLLMVDLAGSERVRRTVSKGARLSEAKSINTSLSALGNVIAALAEQNVQHVPYRDSKLTRLLQDSLGGTASTALIATVGPAAVNYGETLSTLMFASRCMAVKSAPLRHEEVDYAEMCATLQARVNSMEGEVTARLLKQQEHYEGIIEDLTNKLEKINNNTTSGGIDQTIGNNEGFYSDVHDLLNHLETIRSDQNPSSFSSWLNKPEEWTLEGNSRDLTDKPDGILVAILGYCFEIVSFISVQLPLLLDANMESEERQKTELSHRFEEESKNEEERSREKDNMDREDPRNRRLWEKQQMSKNDPGLAGKKPNLSEEEEGNQKIGSHLASLSRLEALTRVEGQYRSNNEPIHLQDRTVRPIPIHLSYTDGSGDKEEVEENVVIKPALFHYETVEEVAAALTAMHRAIKRNFASLQGIMVRKDHHYLSLKQELADQLVEKRKREEEVVNWSYILKYLLSSASKLRKQLQDEKKANLHFGAKNLPHLHVQEKKSQEFEKDSEDSESNSDHRRSIIPSFSEPKQPRIENAVIQRILLDRKTKDTASLGSVSRMELSARSIEQPRVPPEGRRSPTRRNPIEHGDVEPPANRRRSQSYSSAGSFTKDSSLAQQKPSGREDVDPYQVRSIASHTRAGDSRESPRTLPSHNLNRFYPQPALNGHQRQAQPREQILRMPAPPLDDEDLEDDYDQLGAASPPVQFDGLPLALEIDPSKGYAFSVDESDLSVTETNQSLRSNMNTPLSAAPPDGRRDFSQHYDGPTYASNGYEPQRSRPIQQQQSNALPRPRPTSANSRASSRGGESLGSRKSAPSAFAQEVVQDLGVEGKQAAVAMSVIDKVSQITPEQLNMLDPATRAQILQIRKDLKLDERSTSSSLFNRSRGSAARASEQKRASSTSRIRVSGPTASSLSQLVPAGGQRRSNSAQRSRVSGSSRLYNSQEPSRSIRSEGRGYSVDSAISDDDEGYSQLDDVY